MKIFYRIIGLPIVVACLLSACTSDQDDIDTPILIPPGNIESSGISKIYTLGDTLSHTNLTLDWADEFNDGDMPNEEFWSYEKGFVRNQELQYYTEARPENCRIENGMLVITGQKEETPFGEEKANYTSASLVTQRKKSWQYGRFEIKAKVPKGKGPWPAFWAKGVNSYQGVSWPTCGEIDIMEFATKEPFEMVHNIFWGNDSIGKKSKVKKVQSDIPYYEDFHVYSLNWNKNQLVFAIDNIVTHTVNMADVYPNPFHQEFFLLLNMALGTPTNNSMGGMLDDSCLPVQFFVDYVRVYQEIEK